MVDQKYHSCPWHGIEVCGCANDFDHFCTYAPEKGSYQEIKWKVVK